MKRVMILILAFVSLLIFSGCQTYQDGYSAGYDAGHDEGYSDGYSDGKSEALNDDELHKESTGYGNGYEYGDADTDEEIVYYMDAISYYEILCDELGYRTYDMFAYPEKWCYYCVPDELIFHQDWLCPLFGKDVNYFSSSSPDYYKDFEGYVQCDYCPNPDYCFLDVEAGLYHKQKSNLDLGSEDFIHPNINYRLVSEERAIENGYFRCSCCEFN